MQMPFSKDRTPALASLLCLALVAGVAGCASKNPLMDDAPAQATARPAAAPSMAADGAQRTGPTGLRRFLGVLSPYRVDVQQGNFVSRETVDQLKEGMRSPDGVTREQVKFVLGTPLLADPFHADRWDYVFRLQKRNGEVLTSHVTAHFQGNKLVDIDGGNLPTEKEYLAMISGSAPGDTPSVRAK
ncbi:outer membrane protein assembly factor BamE [Noviherbaspirillum humi]|uniref:Outer membrane protein assembly factor BamE n=1 Tax=Noviherbaspirillum humi TaxID=1688639 RepID=A0A239E5A7_9BURK|nr:outer membrane protein assembly factor BamE [Noviherbaspirillum humi]SNS39639.1 outer membrane protein assembly factor BamE [Noviherbaspirillum humi]